MAITIPDEYAYVLLSLTGLGVLNAYHFVLTASARRACNVLPPIAYVSAEEAASDIHKYRFNCAQRAHANFTESSTTIIAGAAVAGLKYPILTASMAGVWLAARFIYARGYAKSVPGDNGGGRFVGVWFLLPQAGLMGLSVWTGVKLAMELL